MSKSADDLKRDQEVLKQQMDQVRKEHEAIERAKNWQQSILDQQIIFENARALADVDWKAVDEYLNGRNGNPGVLAFTGQESYKEYSTAMMTFFGSVVNFHKALVADKAVSRAVSWVFSREFSLDDIGLGFISDKAISGDELLKIGNKISGILGDFVANKVTKFLTGETPTPETRYQLEVDENGKLTKQIFINNELLPPEKTAIFDMGFEAWLDQVNFTNQTTWTLDKSTNIIADGNGNLMTMDILEDLNSDPSTNLMAFYTGKFDFKITPLVQHNIDSMQDSPGLRP